MRHLMFLYLNTYDYSMHIKKGDLVKYIPSPGATTPRVIPDNKNPIGIVINVMTCVVGKDPKAQAVIRTIVVRWSSLKWNSKNGLSEEFEPDLELIQRAEKYI